MRRFSGVLGSNGASDSGGRGPDAIPAASDAASRGVAFGYRVIEEYMRQGEAFARSVRSSASPASLDPARLTERMMQSATDLAATWLELAQSLAGQPAAPPRAAPHVGGFGIDEPRRQAAEASRQAPLEPPGGHARREACDSTFAASDLPTAATEAPTVAIDVSSTRRVEVSVDLKPGAARRSLRAHGARSIASEDRRISGIGIDTDAVAGRVVVRLAVDGDQPAGTYAGVVVDDVTNLPQGTIYIRVFDRLDPPETR